MEEIHTTNCPNQLIAVAPDCTARAGQEPPYRKGRKKSVARLQFELLNENPYRFTSDEALFRLHAIRSKIPEAIWPAEQAHFFSIGRPCFRASPLAKRYGWGIHSDANCRVALCGAETLKYVELIHDPAVWVVEAMRTKKPVVQPHARHDKPESAQR